jgi:hypothetical protein
MKLIHLFTATLLFSIATVSCNNSNVDSENIQMTDEELIKSKEMTDYFS